MNDMTVGQLRLMICVVALSAISVLPVSAEEDFDREAKEVSNFLLQLGMTNDFSAVLHYRIKHGEEENFLAGEHAVFRSGVKLRIETDIRKMSASGKFIPPDELAGLVKRGNDRGIIISRPDKNMVYMLSPSVKAYCEFPHQSNSLTNKTTIKVQATNSPDTVDGHPCTKHEMLVKGTGSDQIGTVWFANDLSNFPVRAEWGNTHMRFTDIQLQRPADSLFEVPVGYVLTELAHDSTKESPKTLDSKLPATGKQP